jgi:aminoglycoside phosphotransferase (APT) family kinase protein
MAGPATAGSTGLAESLRERATKAAQQWAPGAEATSVQPLTGGSSSLTFLASLVGAPEPHSRVVLKVAPPGLPPVRNRDVLRQGRLMAALHGRPGIPVPPLLFEDAGSPPYGAADDAGSDHGAPPFVAMGLIPGECMEPVLSESRDPAGFAEIRARALDAARALAALHSVDPARTDLRTEPVVTLADEIDRWTRAFTTVPPDLQGEYERCARALHATIPPALPPVINHGDYRLGNTLCAEGRVNAIIDWEIWSAGDPRIDLSWFTFFTDEAKHPAMPSPGPTGMPAAAELLAVYGTELPDMRWFDALTRYKEAGATALLIKRGRKTGQMPGLVGRMTPALPLLLREAEELLAQL